MRLLDLQHVAPNAEETFGGKACGLARLIAAGVDVPTGFAVSATTVPPSRWPEEVKESFRRRVSELARQGPLAVRSSAVGEDGAAKSFAGLFETVLGVNTAEEAFDAAALCIRSGGRRRVLEYAGAAEALRVGLVVQELVEPQAAGVCFAKDPDGAVLIEAVTGRGDKLVGGKVDPEGWRSCRSDVGGWECLAESPRHVLTDRQASDIAAQAAGLAEQFQCPLNLEWAVDSTGMLRWLQARPLTSALPLRRFVIQRSCEDADDGPVTVWSNWNVRETMPEPLFPLTWTVWRDVVLPTVTSHLFGVPQTSTLLRHLIGLDFVHGRMYFNMNAFTAAPLFGPFAANLLTVVDRRAGEAVRRLTSAGVLRPRRLPGSRPALFVRMLSASLKSALRLSSGLLPRRALAVLEKDGKAVARRGAVSELSGRELVEEMRLLARPECRRLLYGLQMEAFVMAVYGSATRAFNGHPRAQQLLATGINANPTTQISIAIDELVEAGRPLASIFDEPLSAEELLRRLAGEPHGVAWLSRFRRFEERFGHRGPMEFDLGAARWSETPSMIIELIRIGLASPSRENLSRRMARLSAERREAVAEAVAGSPAWRRPILRWLARLVELYMPLREAPKHYGLMVFQRMRQATLELGRRLVRGGVLESVDDVFFLEWPELVAFTDGHPPPDDLSNLVRQRREQLACFRKEPAPDFLRSDGRPVVEEAQVAGSAAGFALEGVLRGTGVSSGRASGTVRVLAEPDPTAMREGDVIVMKYADPGWTPLFPRASAVVMEVGGLMCHAAVVAREMGIPAVAGVGAATRLLSDDQFVDVDGGLGTVTPAKARRGGTMDVE